MIARRLPALFLALFTLHLNLLGADFACARHGAGAAAMTAEMSGHTEAAGETTTSAHAHAMPASHEMGGMTVSDNGDEHPPCEVPVQSNCCRALTSCSVVFSSEDELQVASAPHFREMIALGRMSAPPSESAAPEPPPPKA